MTKLLQRSVLRYQQGRRSQATVRRHFLEWRARQGPPIPVRCDIPSCQFFSGNLLWNGKPIRLVLDHVNGVSGDNSPQSLRLLCPNCNSQQGTHGGSNKGRVIQDMGGYAFPYSPTVGANTATGSSHVRPPSFDVRIIRSGGEWLSNISIRSS